MPSISQTLLNLQQSLQKFNHLSTHEASIEAQVILSHVTQLSRTELEINHNQVLDQNSQDKIADIIEQRLKRIPLQYILGEAYFYGLKFQVNPSVLIPRPETEIMVEKAISILCQKETINALEIGTGSGCISIALAKTLQEINPDSNIKILATDISQDAITIAKSNALNHSVDELITFEHVDLIPKDYENKNFDLLISNPPYISELEYKELSPEVQKEPHAALVGNQGNTGYEFYERISQLSINYSNLLLELDPSRSEAIQEIYTSKDFSRLSLIEDLSGMKRFLYGMK